MDERLTKLTGSMLAAVRDQVECLIERGDVDPAQIKVLLNPAARQLAVMSLKAQGNKPDEIAERLGVNRATVFRDLAVANATPRLEESKKNRDGGVAFATESRTWQKQEARREREQALALKTPEGKYGVVYADPPWRFEVYSEDTGQGRTAEAHYSTMATEDIAQIPVASFAANDCVLFMWTTPPTLPEAFTLLNAWGFSYKTHCIWVKDKIGLGFWLRNQHEMLIVATRGKVPAPAPGTQWSSIIEAPRGRHSEKPELFYDLIETYFPTLPKIELFARSGRDGWKAWGFEAPAEAAE